MENTKRVLRAVATLPPTALVLDLTTLASDNGGGTDFVCGSCGGTMLKGRSPDLFASGIQVQCPLCQQVVTT